MVTNKEIIEWSVKQLNNYINGINVLVNKEGKVIESKSGSKVQVRAVKPGKKEFI